MLILDINNSLSETVFQGMQEVNPGEPQGNMSKSGELQRKAGIVFNGKYKNWGPDV